MLSVSLEFQLPTRKSYIISSCLLQIVKGKILVYQNFVSEIPVLVTQSQVIICGAFANISVTKSVTYTQDAIHY